VPTDLLDPRVDPPLTVLIPKDGPPVTVCAAPPVLDTVQRLQQAQERITEALIANQDQLAALRALIGVPIDALSDDTALELMLTEALELTGSDCAVLVRGDAVLLVGPARRPRSCATG